MSNIEANLNGQYDFSSLMFSTVSNINVLSYNLNYAEVSAEISGKKILIDVVSDEKTNLAMDIYSGTFLINQIKISNEDDGSYIFIDNAKVTSAALRSFATGGDLGKLVEKATYNNDIIHVVNGSGVAYGGHGEDTVLLDGSRKEFEIHNTNSAFHVENYSMHVELNSIENVVFSDGILITDLDSQSASFYRIYNVLLGRNPSGEEIKNYIFSSDSSYSKEDIVHNVINSDEFLRSYHSSDLPSVLEAVYNNIFGVSPSNSDLTYWGSQIENGTGRIESIAAGWADGVEAKSKFGGEGSIWLDNIKIGDDFQWRMSIVKGIFEKNFYVSNNEDVRHADVDPLAHYVEFGWKEGRDPSGMFDVSFYLDHNADVQNSGVDPLAHYAEFGWKEGRNPSASFDTNFYLSHNEDVRNAGINPLEHYMQYGWKEGRDPSANFDTDFYLSHNEDVRNAGINPLEHYMQYGWKEGRDPSANFDTDFYLSHNEDVRNAGINPLEHYMQYGLFEGRQPSGDLLG